MLEEQKVRATPRVKGLQLMASNSQELLPILSVSPQSLASLAALHDLSLPETLHGLRIFFKQHLGFQYVLPVRPRTTNSRPSQPRLRHDFRAVHLPLRKPTRIPRTSRVRPVLLSHLSHHLDPLSHFLPDRPSTNIVLRLPWMDLLCREDAWGTVAVR